MIVRVAAAVFATALPLLASEPWTSGVYRYDGAGNIVAVGDRTYGYDAASRMTRAHIAGTSYAYEYDAYGNRNAYSINQQHVTVPVTPATNRLSDAAYDAVGNQLVRGSTSATFDGFGMMTGYRFDSVNAETFVYTANDERIGVLRGDTWTWSFRDAGGRVLRQYRSSSTSPTTPWIWLEDFVYRGPAILGSERPPADGGPQHYHLDHLGSPRLVTSAAGAVISEHDFLPFGEERTPLGQQRALGFDREPRHRFTGHERDFDTATPNDSSASVDYLHARYYVAKTGRFLSVDPVLDVKRSTREPQSWNRYSYVMNNPINRNDPTGKVDQNWDGGSAAQLFPDDRTAQLEFDQDVAEKTAVWSASVIGSGFALRGAAGGAIALYRAYQGYKAVQAGQRLASTATAAYKIAQEGGKHAGTLANYANRATKEIANAVKGYERVIAQHIDKLKDPAKYIADWGNKTPAQQQIIRQKWLEDIARNRELRDVLYGVLQAR